LKKKQAFSSRSDFIHYEFVKKLWSLMEKRKSVAEPENEELVEKFK
jgi:hypothetical protein